MYHASETPSEQNTAARRTGPAVQPVVIEKLATQSMTQLTSALGSVLGRVDDALFDFMQAPGHRQDATRYIDAMRELRLRRSQIEKRFQEEIGVSFKALLEGRVRVADFSRRGVDAGSSLSLVSEEDLEVQLAAKQLSQSLEHGFGQLLTQLDQRVGWLAGGLELSNSTNPVGPGHIAAAIHFATSECDVSLHVKLILYKLCERELAAALEDAYHHINQWLIDAGVLPTLPQLRARQGLLRKRAPTPAPAKDYDDSHYEAQAQELFGTLHQLLSFYRHSAPGGVPGESFSGVEGMRALKPQEMLDVLSLLQSEMPKRLRVSQDAANEPLAFRVKREVLNYAGRLGLDSQSTGLDPVDEDAIDLVGMLFEVLLDEREIQGRGRDVVGRLVVPFIKVALMDRKMFLRKTHPARRLLNTLAEACEQNPGETPAERELLAKAESVVERLNAEFSENIAIFEVLLEEMSSYLEQYRKRVELAERRAAEAHRGRERLEQARERVFAEIESRLANRNMPPSLELLLRSYWSHHLMVVSLRQGEASEEYHQGLAVGDALIACLDEAHYGMAGLLSGLSGLRPGLEKILGSSGVTGESAAIIVRAISEELRQIGRGETPAEHAAQSLSESVPPPLVSVSESESNYPELRLVSDRDALDYQQADIERIQSLPIGTWVELTDAQGNQQSVKLAWVSPISSRLMFVNKRGMRVCVASAVELAVMIGEGRLNLRNGNPAFERAMQKVLGRLQTTAAAA